MANPSPESILSGPAFPQTDPQEEARLAAMCNRLGHLWSEQHIEVWEDAPSPLHCYDFSTCAF